MIPKLIMKIHMYNISIVRCCFDIIEIIINCHLELSVSFFFSHDIKIYLSIQRDRDRRMKYIVCFSRFSVQGKAAKNRGHQKEHQRRDTGKNYSFFDICLRYSISYFARHPTLVQDYVYCLFLFHCVDLIIIILRDMHKA